MPVNNFEDHDVQMLELSALHQWKQGADEESTTITTFSHEYHFGGKDWKNSVVTEGEGELQEITGNIRSWRHNLEVKRKTS